MAATSTVPGRLAAGLDNGAKVVRPSGGSAGTFLGFLLGVGDYSIDTATKLDLWRCWAGPRRPAAPHGHCAPRPAPQCQRQPERQCVPATEPRRTSPGAARRLGGEWHMHPAPPQHLAPPVFRDCAGPRTPQADPIIVDPNPPAGPLSISRQSQPQDDDSPCPSTRRPNRAVCPENPAAQTARAHSAPEATA
jgi:hypothetical protein